MDDLGEASDEEFARAERLASLVRLKPTLFRLEADPQGFFGFSGHDLITTSVGHRNHDFETDFEGRVVKDKEAAAEVAATLAGRSDDPRWPFARWLRDSVERGYTVLAMLEPGTDREAGFVAYRRKVDVDAYDGSLEVNYCIAPECVYVSPDCRGMSVSSALRRAIMEDVLHDVDDLRRMTRSKAFRDFGDVTVKMRIRGDAHSKEGLAFLDALTLNLEAAVETAFEPGEAERLGCARTEMDYSM